MQVSRSALREARFLAECSHCNITTLKEAYQSASGRVYLVLEYAHHVLSQQLKAHRTGLPVVAVRSIVFQLLQALHYLHNKGIMHRGSCTWTCVSLCCP
jgi:serine/threonine protein kinase